MATALDLTAKELDAYRAAAQRRRTQEQRELARREQRVCELARQAAALLRERFGATRVVAFGSLVHAGCFTFWSDVDVAAWDIRPQDTFRAMGAAMDMDQEIKVSLVDIAACSASLRSVIEQEGVDL